MDNLISIIIVTYNRKNDIVKCLDSIFESSYINFEIIVVDNASTDGTVDLLAKEYPDKIKLIKSEKNLMAGGGRNLGAKYASGEYLLFIDSDNVIDKEMIRELIIGAETLKNVGMVGPLMYYLEKPDKIWWAGADINSWTSQTNYLGINKKDEGQYNEIRKVGHIPNIFMIKKSIWEQAGGIDSNFVMHYEESDLAEKIRKNGYFAYIIPSAKTWHNVPFGIDQGVRKYGGESEQRTYYTARNRVLFMRRNSTLIKSLFFLLIFNNIFVIAYCVNYLRNNKLKLVWAYLKGTIDGIINR